MQPGEWHLHFVNSYERSRLRALPYEARDLRVLGSEVVGAVRSAVDVEDLKKLSAARCASTSYKTVDGFDMTIERAIALVDKLIGSTPLHASPFEHVAQADEVLGDEGWGCCVHPEQHGNFKGFRQWRKMLPGESQ